MDKLTKFYNKKEVYKYNSHPDSLHSKALQFIKGSNCILDVGCADGYIGKFIKQRGSIVYGIEVSSKMGAKAKKILDKVYIGNIETDTFPLQNKYFDAILLMDVLEHLFEPLTVLKKLNNYLKDDGIMVITLPNIANWEIRYNLLRGHFDYQQEGILDEGHLRFFTFDNAKRLIKNAKLEIISTDFVPTMPLVLLKLRNRFPFLGIDKLVNINSKLFAYQFIFVVRKYRTNT